MRKMSYSIEKIVAAVDLSESSLNAVHIAAALAKRNNATLQILHIIDNTFDYFPGSASENLHSKDIIQAIANSICDQYELEPKVIHAEGTVSQTILRTAFDTQCNLVVMGRHGASGDREYFVGSNTYNVIKHTYCPVLIIPPGHKTCLFKSVLYPIRPVKGALCDYDIVCHFLNKEGILNVLGLTHVSSGRQKDVLKEIVAEIADELKADSVKAKVCWSKGLGVADDILLASIEDNTQLLVVNSILDVYNKDFFIGPNAQRIINHAKNPLLAIPKYCLSLSERA